LELKVISINRYVKVWIFISLCALLVWILYWVPSSIDRFFGMDGTPWDVILQDFGLIFIAMEISGAIGNLVRLAGVIVGILSLVLVMVYKKKFFEIKKWVVFALILEGTFYFLFLPAVLFLLGFSPARFGGSILMGINYLLIVLFTTPFLFILAYKIMKYDSTIGFKSWTLVGITFVGYIVSLWSNSVIKWFDMISAEGLAFFFTGIRSLGAINAILLMSFGILFAIFSARSFTKYDFNSASKWIGMTFLVVGMHYLIYVIYSFLVGMEHFLMLSELWAIPLIGLGLTMLLKPLDQGSELKS
jgi:hypothetical protein